MTRLVARDRLLRGAGGVAGAILVLAAVSASRPAAAAAATNPEQERAVLYAALTYPACMIPEGPPAQGQTGCVGKIIELEVAEAIQETRPLAGLSTGMFEAVKLVFEEANTEIAVSENTTTPPIDASTGEVLEAVQRLVGSVRTQRESAENAHEATLTLGAKIVEEGAREVARGDLRRLDSTTFSPNWQKELAAAGQLPALEALGTAAIDGEKDSTFASFANGIVNPEGNEEIPSTAASLEESGGGGGGLMERATAQGERGEQQGGELELPRLIESSHYFLEAIHGFHEAKEVIEIKKYIEEANGDASAGAEQAANRAGKDVQGVAKNQNASGAEGDLKNTTAAMRSDAGEEAFDSDLVEHWNPLYRDKAGLPTSEADIVSSASLSSLAEGAGEVEEEDKATQEVERDIKDVDTIDPVMLANLLTTAPAVIVSIVNLIANVPSTEELILKQEEAIEQMIEGLSEQLHEGFERVEAKLKELSQTLDYDTELLKNTSANVVAIRNEMSQVQDTLDQIQADLFAIASTQREEAFQTALNTYLGYRTRTPDGSPLPLSEFEQGAGLFYTWGFDDTYNAVSENPRSNWPTNAGAIAASLGSSGSGSSYSNALDFNLDYLSAYVKENNWGPAADAALPNPEVWSAGASAFTQLLFENSEDVTKPLLAETKQLSRVGSELPTLSSTLTEPESQTPPTIDGIELNTGSSVFNHAIANYLYRAIGPALNGEASFVSRLEAQQNQFLSEQDPGGKADCHAGGCSLAFAPTQPGEPGEAGDPLFHLWSGTFGDQRVSEEGNVLANQVPSSELAELQAEPDGRVGGKPEPQTMNACFGGDTANSSLLNDGQDYTEDPVEDVYANAWHLGLGKLEACYEAAGSDSNNELEATVKWTWCETGQCESLTEVTGAKDGEFEFDSKVLKSRTGRFAAPTDIGLELTGVSTSIVPAGTTIVKVISASEVELSAVAEANRKQVTFGLKRPPAAQLRFDLNVGGSECGNVPWNEVFVQFWEGSIFGERGCIVGGGISTSSGAVYVEEAAETLRTLEAGETLTNCGEVFFAGSAPSFAAGCEAALAPTNTRVKDAVVAAIGRLQERTYGNIASSRQLTPLNEVQGADERLNGSRALVDDYVELGLPRAMLRDPELRESVTGNEHLPDNSSEDEEIYAYLSKQAREAQSRARLSEELHAPDPATGKFEPEVLARTKALVQALETANQASGAEGVEAHTDPLVSATLARVGLTEFVLEPDAVEARPQNVKPPEVLGERGLGNTLRCDEGEWRGDPPPTFSDRWYRGSEQLNEGKTHTVAPGDVGEELYCEVTASNSEGEATARSKAVKIAVVANVTIEDTQALGPRAETFTREELVGAPGQTAEYEIAVTNTGNVPVTLTNLNDASCVNHSGFTEYELLSVGGAVTYRCERTLTDGRNANETTLEAIPPQGSAFTITRMSNEVVIRVGIAVKTLGAESVGQTAATLRGTVDPNGGVVEHCAFTVYYSVPLKKLRSVKCTPPSSGSGPTEVTAEAPKLQPETEYHYLIEASNKVQTAEGELLPFTTLVKSKPSITNAKAIELGDYFETVDGQEEEFATATLVADVDPNGTEVTECVFKATEEESGIVTEGPCEPSPGAGSAAVPVHIRLKGLEPHECFQGESNCGTRGYYSVVIKAVSAGGKGEGFAWFAAQAGAPPAPRAEVFPASPTKERAEQVYGSELEEGTTVTHCELEYAKTSPISAAKTSEKRSLACNSFSGATLTPLSPATRYYVRLKVEYLNENGFGREVFSPEATFETQKVAKPAKPPKVRTDKTEMKATSATLHSEVNPEGNQVTECKFEYATSPPSGSSPHVNCQPAPPLGGGVYIPVDGNLQGLAASTPYYYKLTVHNEGGAATATGKFKTTAPAVPTVATGAAEDVTATTATLTATVNPEGSEVKAANCFFVIVAGEGSEEDVPCQLSGPLTGGTPQKVEAMATVLVEKDTYHFWISAQNAIGRSVGSHVEFKTLASPQAEKLTGDGESGEGLFGESVALAGNGSAAVVGAPFNSDGEGAVWAFAPSGEAWSNPGVELTTGELDAHFGSSVALSADGKTAIFGAPYAGSSLQGAALVYTRFGSTWTEQARLTDASGLQYAQFGSSVALSANGNTAVIGGPEAAGGVGRVWVFTRSGTTWSEQEELSGAGETGFGHFGSSVALSGIGETALVGGDEDNDFAGAAWVFTYSGTSWTQQGSKLTGSSSRLFGAAVALSGTGNTALIGAPEDAPAETGAGYVYTRSGGTWSQQAMLAVAGENGALLGSGVSLSESGNMALLGAPGSEDSSKGTAWRFTRAGTVWTAAEGLKGSDEEGSGNLGKSVSLSAEGNIALAGGPGDDDEVGAAWVFREG